MDRTRFGRPAGMRRWSVTLHRQSNTSGKAGLQHMCSWSLDDGMRKSERSSMQGRWGATTPDDCNGSVISTWADVLGVGWDVRCVWPEALAAEGGKRVPLQDSDNDNEVERIRTLSTWPQIKQFAGARCTMMSSWQLSQGDTPWQCQAGVPGDVP